MHRGYMFDVEAIRQYFPILSQPTCGIYFDNAATTQKPSVVLEAMDRFYREANANTQRGAYGLAKRAEDHIHAARVSVQHFIHAAHPEEVIFTYGTTDGIHTVAQTYGRTHVKEGDEVVISVMEHHSNYLPWQALCEEQGARLRVVPLTSDGLIDTQALKECISARTKVVAVSYMSNVLGTVQPIKEICQLAHRHGAAVVVDAAQAVAHVTIDVQALDCDFLVFSGHKIYGPTGIGVLYGKQALLTHMPPHRQGGGGVTDLSQGKAAYAPPPYRFEVGTQPSAAIVGLGAALQWVEKIGLDAMHRHSRQLTSHFVDQLASWGAVQWAGGITPTLGIATFNLSNTHALDIGMRLDSAQIAVRTGAFCAKPLMDYLQLESAVRVSFALYNTTQEVDRLYEVLREYFDR